MITIRCRPCGQVHAPPACEGKAPVTPAVTRHVTKAADKKARHVTPCKRCKALEAEIETLKRQLVGRREQDAERQRRRRERKKVKG